MKIIKKGYKTKPKDIVYVKKMLPELGWTKNGKLSI